MAIDVRQRADTVTVPPWIPAERGVKQFQLGAYWFHLSRERGERISGPLTMRYLLNNLKWMSEKGLFNGTQDEWAIVELSFVLGMLSQEQ